MKKALAITALLLATTLILFIQQKGRNTKTQDQPEARNISTNTPQAKTPATPLASPNAHAHQRPQTKGRVKGTDIPIYDPSRPDDPEYQIALGHYYDMTENDPSLKDGNRHICPPRPYDYYKGWEENRERLLKKHAVSN